MKRGNEYAAASVSGFFYLKYLNHNCASYYSIPDHMAPVHNTNTVNYSDEKRHSSNIRGKSIITVLC